MATSPPFERKPLIIDGNALWSGDHSTTFAPENPDSLLRTYLIFVREMRGQKREPSIALRSEDLGVLAMHLGTTEEVVLGGLLDMMGATRAQRSTMLALLAAGALTVVLSGTIVNGLTSDGLSVPFERLADAVRSAITTDSATDPIDEVAVSGSSGAANSSASERAATQPATPESAVADAATSAPATAATPSATDTAAAAAAPTESSTMAATLLAELTLSTPTDDVLRSAAAASPPSEDSTAPETATGSSSGAVAQEPVSIGIAPDGSLVASVAPPVPATTASDEPVATATLPDGSTVGVAAPPVPPPPVDEQVATATLPDGTTVGVAVPPVPPAPEG